MDFLVSVLLLQFLFLRQDAHALKLRYISVPEYSFSNETVHLECSYDLESHTLYSVTWYKDDEEFYKYEPKAEPNQIWHPVEGVKLNHHGSDSQKVILKNVNLKSKGIYKCDVIAEAFNFPSVRAEAYMEVIVLPESSPRITGEEKIYASGDILTLNCTSDKSYPPARLTWFINGVKVNPDSETHIPHQDLISTGSSLRLELGPDHLSAGQINVRCESVVETSERVSKPFVDLRHTQVFVQGDARMMNPNTWLIAALILHRIALAVG